MKTIHLLIIGKVQGVFFRASTKDEAIKHGIKGWVQNKQNGDVEVLASGEEKNLEEFVKWCHKGPSKAIVKNVVISKINEPYLHDFHIKKEKH